MHLVKCSMCGYEFDPANAQSACDGCPLVPDCHLMRCPRCGYEMPPEAKLISLVRRLRERAHERAQAKATGAKGLHTSDLRTSDLSTSGLRTSDLSTSDLQERNVQRSDRSLTKEQLK